MMTVHKLSAGDGYTYLTRQVASADEGRTAGQSLADYYTARGNPPGVWLGGGAQTLGVARGEVTEAQMKALFGEGRHPDAEAMIEAGATPAETRLGAGYLRFGDATHRQPVAGYDLVFTPVKSASVLWALGGPDVRRQVEDAHHEAVRATIAWVEQHAAYTRTGHAGVAQVDTTGLIAAAFDHRESRSGDPDLHTHVAISNKVCSLDGRWRSLDARLLHSLGVAASERYNTRFEDALARRLGVRFQERPGTAPGKRPVREIVGVPRKLVAHFSRRRALIEDRYAELLAAYRAEHGREPVRSAQLRLAQQATLETREGKGPGRTLAEQVADWTDQANAGVGPRAVERMVRAVTSPGCMEEGLDESCIDRVARRVVHTVSAERSTWTVRNAYAEAERRLRGYRFRSAQEREDTTERVVARAISSDLAIRIEEPELLAEPAGLRRDSDGRSVFVVHGGERYTTSRVLEAEESLVSACVTRADAVDPLVAAAALAVHDAEDGVRLDEGQRQLVGFFASHPAVLSVGIGPAGAGKTTAVRAYAAVLAADGRRLVPLATSARAAEVLGSELGLRAENLHKFLHEHQREDVEEWYRLSPGDVVLVDEAGMAATLQLAEVVHQARKAGASVRLIGDPAQLASVDAGGALRLLETEVGAVHLDHLHRFADPAEARATLQLRDGDPNGLEFYHRDRRIREGSREAMLEAAYEGWASDTRAGRRSILVAVTVEDVRALNARARAERVGLGAVECDGVALADGNRAGAGDWVVTRTNVRGLVCRRGGDWVKNGDTWEVARRHRDGSLSVRHRQHGGRVRLPAAYVAESVELAYASTAHRAQGITVDTAHALVTPEMTRESLYVASTRGRDRTSWYAVTDSLLGPGCEEPADPRKSGLDVLTMALRHHGAETAASTVIREVQREATTLSSLVPRYRHAWDLAARSALHHVASTSLGAPTAARVTNGKGSRHLATVLAEAVAQGADPGALLQEAAAGEHLENVPSPAFTLADRIQDLCALAGRRSNQQPDRPLPWLPSPSVGHPQWDRYLADRAQLVADRVSHLGSLAAAYREQYHLTHLPSGELGERPPEMTAQEDAYLAVIHERSAMTKTVNRTSPTPTPVPSRPLPPQRRGPHLAR